MERLRPFFRPEDVASGARFILPDELKEEALFARVREFLCRAALPTDGSKRRDWAERLLTTIRDRMTTIRWEVEGIAGSGSFTPIEYVPTVAMVALLAALSLSADGTIRVHGYDFSGEQWFDSPILSFSMLGESSMHIDWRDLDPTIRQMLENPREAGAWERMTA